MPRLVISDTSPLRYLVLIGEADLLPALYSEVLIPEAVADELNHPSTPEAVGAGSSIGPSGCTLFRSRPGPTRCPCPISTG